MPVPPFNATQALLGLVWGLSLGRLSLDALDPREDAFVLRQVDREAATWIFLGLLMVYVLFIGTRLVLFAEKLERRVEAGTARTLWEAQLAALAAVVASLFFTLIVWFWGAGTFQASLIPTAILIPWVILVFWDAEKRSAVR